MSLNPAAKNFRERFRAYGVAIETAEVPAHLANGWRFADPEEPFLAQDALLLRAPARPEA